MERVVVEDAGRIVVSPLAVERVCCTLALGQVVYVIMTGVMSHIRRVYYEEVARVPDPNVSSLPTTSHRARGTCSVRASESLPSWIESTYGKWRASLCGKPSCMTS